MLVLAIALAIGLLLIWRVPPRLAGFPVAAVSTGNTKPPVGLVAPLPAWILLPAKVHVTGASTLPPQPPYGASAEVMIRLDESVEMFVSSYRTRLKQAGFSMRSHPVLANRLLLDPALEAVYEADETKGGRTIYIAIRGIGATHFAQLTFWSPPSPRM